VSGGEQATCVACVRDSKAGGVAEAGSGRLASAVHDVSEQARLSDRDRIPSPPPDVQVRTEVK